MKQIKKHRMVGKKLNALGSNCQYRQKKQVGPPDCRKVGWLKFLIPKVSTDRIWLMRITSSQSIDSLNQYFSLQKEHRQSVKGKYILFLRKVENSKMERLLVIISLIL